MYAWVSVARRVGVSGLLAAIAAALAMAAIIWAYWTAWHAPAAGIFHDDGVYAVTAKALAEGRGYRILSLPDEIPQTKYPVLFPALLAVVWRLAPEFPRNLILLKAVPLVCAVLWCVASFRLLRRETRDWRIASAIVALVVVSPWTLFLSTALLSETLFALLVTASLALLCHTDAYSRAMVALSAALAGAAFLTRTAGIALIGAGILWLALRGRWRHAAAFALICAVMAAPWLWWQIHAGTGLPDHDVYYSRGNYQSWNVVANFALAQKERIVIDNVMYAVVAPAALMGSAEMPGGVLLAVGIGLLTALGFAGRMVRGPGPPEVFVLLYSTLLLLWAWPSLRFLAPLLPLLLLYTYWGAKSVCGWLRCGPRATALTLSAIAIALLISGATATAHAAWAARDHGAPALPKVRQDDWDKTARMFAWLKHATPPDAVLMGNLDPALYLFTGRQAVRGFMQDPYLLYYSATAGAQPLGTADGMFEAIQRNHVAYLVCSPNALFREGPHLTRLIQQIVKEHRSRLQIVYQDENAAYRVYKIVDPSPELADLQHARTTRDLKNSPRF